MSGWWQCISSLPTMLWHFAAFGASPISLSTPSIGGLCVRMVAVLQLTTAHNASATYLLRCSFQQRQALVAYLSGWWQCFGSLLPAMLWRPTYRWWQCFSSLLPTMLRRPKGKRWWPICQDGGSASAHYCQQCFGDLRTYLLRCFRELSQHNKYWWPMCQDGGSASAHYCQQCFGDLPTSVLFSAKASVGGLCVRMVAALRLTTANNALATYLLRYFRLLFQQRQAPVAHMCQDCGSASAHYCQQCFGDLPTSVFPLTLSAKGSDGCLRDRKVVVLQLTLEPNCVSRTWPATKGLSRPKSLRSPGCQS